MRAKFPGFYRPTEDEFSEMWSEGLFVFDTNVLLDFFRYSDETVQGLFTIFERIKGRIWIPYRVGYEYHRGLDDFMCKQASNYDISIKKLEEFNKMFGQKKDHPFIDNSLLEEINAFSSKLITELESRRMQLRKSVPDNEVKNRLANLIDNSIGDQFDSDKLSAIYSEGEKRYKNFIPPGYMDKNKPGNEIYEDLIIWKEICEKAITSNKHIILITGDVKEDWFQRISGLTIGPRPELIQEIRGLTNNKSLFYIYSTDSFINHANEKLSIEIEKQIIEEIEGRINENDLFISSSIDQSEFTDSDLSGFIEPNSGEDQYNSAFKNKFDHDDLGNSSVGE